MLFEIYMHFPLTNQKCLNAFERMIYIHERKRERRGGLKQKSLFDSEREKI
jgi:hypothetical protein